MAGTLSDNPFAHLAGTYFTARSDPEVRGTPGGVQQYIWQAITNDFVSAGLPLPPGAFQANNDMLRWSTTVINADAALSKSLLGWQDTGRDVGIESSHIAESIDARPLDQRPEGAQYRVIYKTVYSVEGQTFTDTFQHDFGYALPETVGGLYDAIEEAAALQVSDYGYEWEGAAVPISIRAY